MKNILRILLLFFVSISAFSQGVCDLTNGVEKGAFDAPAAVCLGEAVKVQDKSGGTDIKYIFGYKGQDAADLTPTRTTPDAEWAFAAAEEYTILQYGKKNGKDMYLCKKVLVRENSEPVFSYLGCNNNRIEIIIPNDPANNFDHYTIDWGDGNPPEIVNSGDLPFKKYKDLSLPRTINVNGEFNTGSTCLASSSKIISAQTGGAFDDPTAATIGKLILEKADEAVLTISGSHDPDGYNLFMTPKGSSYDFTPFRTNISPGDISIPIPDTTKSYCFYIERFNACGIEQSEEICTVILSEVKPIDITSQEILWETYPTRMTIYPNESIYGRFLNSTTKLLKEEDGVLLPVISVSSSQTSYIDNIDCQKKYCYRIQTETSGQLYFRNFTGVSISKQICVDREDLHPPKITDAFVSVSDANTSVITFNDNSSWTLSRNKYMLYRNDGSVFTEIMSNPTKAPFTDATVDNSQQSNCYKIAFIDQCGSTSDLSEAFCTIFLSEADKNELAWTGKTPFADIDANNYDLESYDETTGTSSLMVTLPASQLEYTPNLSSFQEEAKFRIKTTRADGSVSYSNTFTIPLSVKLLFPDAFTPNNDAVNDNLELKGTFKRIANFELQIYNRWGNAVFTSDDPLKAWDGNFQGTLAPADTYTYKIYAKLTDGTEVSKTGKFLLMR